MTQIPAEPLVPGNTLITATPEEGRASAILLSRHSIHAMQKELEVLMDGRAHYAAKRRSRSASRRGELRPLPRSARPRPREVNWGSATGRRSRGFGHSCRRALPTGRIESDG